MKIGTVGFGIGIPRTNLGVSVLNIGKMFFRNGINDPKEKALLIHDLISVCGKSGTFLAAGIVTDWFELDPINDNWAYNTNWLIGKKVEVDISGPQIVRGKEIFQLSFLINIIKLKSW